MFPDCDWKDIKAVCVCDKDLGGFQGKTGYLLKRNE